MSEREYIARRLLARFIDFMIIAALSFVFRPIGPLAALAYSLIADGLFDGQSIGKKLIELRVIIEREDGRKCSYADSALRNIPIAIVVFISFVPIFNLLLVPTAGLCILGFETYLLVTDSNHQHIGDILAGSIVETAPPVEADGGSSSGVTPHSSTS